MEQRVIKFRAWDKNAKIMRDDGAHPNGIPHMKYDVGILPSKARNKWATGVDGLEIRLDSEDFIVMQFTGLKDKAGVEIYEGDILCFNQHFERFQSHYWQKYKVEIPEIYYTWEHESHLREMDVEVIGNVFQNPELINQSGLVISEGLIDTGDNK